jgi:A/G-specific adenine glycosylase
MDLQTGVNDIAGRLLAWYDRHHRDLPWRTPPAAMAAGKRPDPYHVWLSEIMLQQTTVEAVKPYFRAFLAKWPNVGALAAAGREDVMKAWAGLGYYSRARNLKKCADLLATEQRGRFPDTEEDLRALPGIGGYTAAAIAAIAFGRPAAVVDGNVERVVTRLRAIETPMPAAKTEIREIVAGLLPADRPGDFAQAMMDLGATICTPRRPACLPCPPGTLSGDGSENGKAIAARRRLRRRPRRRRGPAAQADRERPSRRHDRSSDDHLDSPDGRCRDCRRSAFRCRLAKSRQRFARFHAFRVGTGDFQG